MTEDAPRDGNWINHHLMVKDLMTSMEKYDDNHCIALTGEMEPRAITMAMSVMDHDIPKGEDVSVGYTVVLGPRAYTATRSWDWSRGHFRYIYDPDQSKAGMRIFAWGSPVIVDPELEFGYVGFVDSHGDQHFCQIKGCWQNE